MPVFRVTMTDTITVEAASYDEAVIKAQRAMLTQWEGADYTAELMEEA